MSVMGIGGLVCGCDERWGWIWAVWWRQSMRKEDSRQRANSAKTPKGGSSWSDKMERERKASSLRQCPHNYQDSNFLLEENICALVCFLIIESGHSISFPFCLGCPKALGSVVYQPWLGAPHLSTGILCYYPWPMWFQDTHCPVY